MADFQILDSDAIDHGFTNSQPTSVAITPQIGDIVFIGSANGSNGADAALSGGGMTWTLLDRIFSTGGTIGFVAAFRATSGTPSNGVLTFTASDTFADMTYAVVRPVDLGTVGVAGGEHSAGLGVATLTIPLTTNSPAGLLAYGLAGGVGTMAQDTGWTEILDENVASGSTHQLMERFSDDSEVIIDAVEGNAVLLGICLEFAASALQTKHKVSIRKFGA